LQEILLAVRQQATCGSKAKEDLSAAQRAITELSSKIVDIRKRAESSEVMVEEICKDIKVLDHGKRNLTTSISTLKRLQMIMAAVDSLKELSEKNQYADCAKLLEGAGGLALRFEMYKRIPKVKDLLEEFTEVKTSIRTKIFEMMDEIDQNLDDDGIRTFSQACKVIDALDAPQRAQGTTGATARDNMVATFSNLQTAAYKSLYRPGLPAGALEKAERRYGELRKILQLYHEQYEQIFPMEWGVPQKICEDFCRVTRSHLKTVLEKQAEQENFVATMLHVLQKTLEFEEELGERYQDETLEEEDMEGGEDEELDAELTALDTTTTVGIRRKYEILRIKEQRQASMTEGGKVEIAPGEGIRRPSKRYRGLISDVFEKYLDFYISAEEKNMRAQIVDFVKKESWIPNDSFTKVLDSSAQMFLAIRESLKRCLALNKEQVMYDLHQRCFRMCLQEYADALEARIERGGGGQHRDIECCMIISTADYCFETSGQLCESIKKSLGEDYGAMVSMQHEQNEFRGAQNKAIMALVKHVGTLLDPAFSTMSKVPWSMHPDVGDHSKYVDQINDVFSNNITKYAENLNASFFNIFCQKLVEFLIPKWTATIYSSCKKINNDGVQQLIVDTGAIRATLIQVPSIGGGKPTNMYKKVVNRDMAKIEDLLRVLMSNNDNDPKLMLEVFENYMKHNKDLTAADFGKIVGLTSFKKVEQDALVEQLARNLKRT